MSDVKWKLVPVEPTEAMLDAGENALRELEIGLSGGECPVQGWDASVYRAMLSASPPAEALPSQTSGADTWSRLDAIRLLAAEDKRQLQILELLETIREQVRTGVKPEHRPEGLMKNLQTAVYGLRGRLPLMNDAAIMAPLQALAKPASEPAGGGVLQEIGLLIEEYDPKNSDWYFRRTVLRELLQRVALSSPASSSPAEAEALQAGVDVSAIMEMFGRWQSGHAFDDDNDADVDLEQRVEAELARLSSAPAQEDGSNGN